MGIALGTIVNLANLGMITVSPQISSPQTLASSMTSPNPNLKQRLQQELQQINWQNVWMGVARPIFVPILVCSLLSYLGGLHQILELMTHFRLQYFLGGLLALLLYGLAKRRVEIFLCLFCVGLNFVTILPW
jgi:hypothetical protein